MSIAWSRIQWKFGRHGAQLARFIIVYKSLRIVTDIQVHRELPKFEHDVFIRNIATIGISLIPPVVAHLRLGTF